MLITKSKFGTNWILNFSQASSKEILQHYWGYYNWNACNSKLNWMDGEPDEDGENGIDNARAYLIISKDKLFKFLKAMRFNRVYDAERVITKPLDDLLTTQAQADLDKIETIEFYPTKNEGGFEYYSMANFRNSSLYDEENPDYSAVTVAVESSKLASSAPKIP